MRTPNIPPPENVELRRDDDLVTETRRYKVITPLFGGGVTPGKADPVTVVRATEVRGHLRFWWRATRGGQFGGDRAVMRAEEERIWGSPGASNKPGPSPVLIGVTVLKKGTPFQAVDRHGNRINNIGHPSSIDSYAAFPLRDKPNPHVLEGVEFELQITYPKHLDGRDIANEVAAALWGWETLGGIGARTRRGFGALQCTQVMQTQGGVVSAVPVALPRNGKVMDYLLEMLAKHVAPGTWPSDVPHLSTRPGNYRVHGAGTGIVVWRELIGRLRSFRQYRVCFHRTKWPEPDEIRRRTGTHKPGHTPVHPVRKFPRAAFGLPIIFEFKNGDVPPEPYKTTLQGARHERLASPLILRPLACNDVETVGLAALLVTPVRPPGGWLLKDAPTSPAFPPISATLDKDAKTGVNEPHDIEPLRNVGDESNVIFAFLKTL